MTSPPIAIVRTRDADRPLVIGLEDDQFLGFDPVDLDFWAFETTDVAGVVNVDPAAVFYGVAAAKEELVRIRAVANRSRKTLPRFAARGHKFPILPDGELSGFPVAATTLRKHRAVVPSIDTIRVSALFAVSTVRTSIEQAELSYDCFGKLYRGRGREMPDAKEIRGCFRGLQNQKATMFAAVAAYAPQIQQVISMGYQDRALRSVLALDTELPNGLGLAKISFTLALLGHDTICLDGRLLGTMFTAKERTKFEQVIGKERGRISEHSLLAYEAAEDAFLAGNQHYEPSDPIGRARAQWENWEAKGGKGATHSVWLDLLPEEEED